jgi:hypothetical protein
MEELQLVFMHTHSGEREKYIQEAIVAYEQAIAEASSLPHEGLEAARLGQQPDWASL